MTSPFDRLSPRKKRAAKNADATQQWDAVFADEDPTRVLPPADSLDAGSASTHGSRAATASSEADLFEDDDRTEVMRPLDYENSPTENISAIRERRVAPSAHPWESSGDRTEPLSAANYASHTEPSPSYERPSPSYREVPPSRPLAQEEFAPVPPAAQRLQRDFQPTAQVRARHSRIHFFPALLGWLATYSLLIFSGYLHRLINELLGLESFTSFPQVFASLIGLGGPVSATPSAITWLVISAVLTLASAAFGGYAAARMARFAAFKQGLGVWLWHLVMVVLATIMTFFAGSLMGTSDSRLSLQTQLDGAVGQNILGVLLLLGLVLLGAILGALFGPRYHKRLARESQQVS